MERFLFESLTTNEQKIQKLNHYLQDIAEVHHWEIKRIANGIILTIEVVRLQAIDLIKNLSQHGYTLERLYEE